MRRLTNPSAQTVRGMAEAEGEDMREDDAATRPVNNEGIVAPFSR